MKPYGFSTLVCMLLTGHDPNDYEIGKRVGLPIINIMNKVSMRTLGNCDPSIIPVLP